MDWMFSLSDEEFEKCNLFAKTSAKTQREHRSGGEQIRGLSQISEDTQRGKVAEIVVKKFLEQDPLDLKQITLDFEIYKRGIWDNSDIEINGKKISIKSAKSFSKWLLLESKDITRGDVYDYYILVLVNKDLRSGKIEGFAFKKELILENSETQRLLQGDFIPGTRTILDADNYARNKSNLHNSTENWQNLVKQIKDN